MCLVLATTLSSAKTADPINMPFAEQIYMGPKNHELDGGSRFSMKRDTFSGHVPTHCPLKYKVWCLIRRVCPIPKAVRRQ